MPTIPNLYELLSELNESKDYATDTLSSIGSSTAHNNNNNDINDDSESSTSKIDPYSLHEFYKYLKQCHCDENLEFFNKTRRFLISENTLSRCCSIDKNYWNDQVYNKFIMVDSPLQCNFPQYVIDNFDKCYLNDIRPSQSDIVNAIEIVMGMLFDAYSRYLNHIQTNDHYSISSNTSVNTSLPEDEENEDQSISQYGLDMDKLNRDIKHMTLTNSMSTLTTTTTNNGNNNNNDSNYTVSKPTMTLNVKLPTTIEMKKNEQNIEDKQQSKKNLIMKGKSFFHKFQKNRYSTNTTKINDKLSKKKKSRTTSLPKGLKRVKSNPITNNSNNTASTSHKQHSHKYNHTHSHTHKLHKNKTETKSQNNKNSSRHIQQAQDTIHHTKSTTTSLTMDRVVTVSTNS